MRLLTHNVLNYPEVLESSRRSSEYLLFFVISIDNDLITEKQLVPRKGVTEQLKGAKSNAVGRGSPVETSAEGRSADRGGSRDQRMNNIRNRAMELVNNDLIYASCTGR